ncbi:hypothetical protein M0R45_029849 [Rubus argutus]|uniref:Uncharacterized protein n=1 Tax=Rubus argutus TaxID=59490 RepID=A0AAW1WBV5_RUBAR
MSKSGFIVDSNGLQLVLDPSRRMTVPTLIYPAGGLSCDSSNFFLAHQYMKLHQPGFRHDRVVGGGFWASDLLIGEESHKKVFPHILSHIRLAEQGKIYANGKECSKEALDREADQYYQGNFGDFGTWFSPSVVLMFLLITLLGCCSIFLTGTKSIFDLLAKTPLIGFIMGQHCASSYGVYK